MPNNTSDYRFLNKKTKYPKCIEFQTINVCNSKCICCPQTYLNNNSFKKMNDESISQIINELSSIKSHLELIIPYLNNEPFLDARIVSILQTIKKNLNVPVEISTNGSLLSKNYSDVIIGEDLVKNIRFSLFGIHPETHHKRMIGLCYKTCIKNIEYFLNKATLKNPNITSEIIMIQVPGLSIDEIEYTKKYFQDYNVSINVFGYLDRAGSLHKKNIMPTGSNDLDIVGCELNRPFERLVIDVNGNCILCSQDWLSDCVIGNIHNDTLFDIWNGKKANDVLGIFQGYIKANGSFLCRKCKLSILS